MDLYSSSFDTKIGNIKVLVDEDGILHRLFFGNEKKTADSIKSKPGLEIMPSSEKCSLVEEEIREFLDGKIKTFNVKTHLSGTDFQLQVWAELAKIPYGTTISYGELANRIGNPKAVRAVGLANGKNPVPIVIPCHRVIGSDGSLTGFGGGLDIKKKLLEIEGVISSELFE